MKTRENNPVNKKTWASVKMSEKAIRNHTTVYLKNYNKNCNSQIKCINIHA